MCAETNLPKPVLTPYVCSPVDAVDELAGRGHPLPGRVGERAGRPSTAAAQTSDRVRSSPVRTIGRSRRESRAEHALEDPRLVDPRKLDAGAARAASTTVPGTSPTSSPPTTSTPSARASARTRSTTSCSGAASTSMTFMLTCTRPDRGRSRPIACTPGIPPLDSPDGAGDGSRDGDVVRREVEVVRDQRVPSADEHPPAARVDFARAGVRDELPRVDPPRELLQAAAPEEDRSSTVRHVAVEEHRQPELAADSSRELARRRDARAAGPSGSSGTSGTTSAAPMRGCTPTCSRRSMRSRCDAMPGEQRVDQRVLVADEREDRAMVVGVGVDVEKLGAARERVGDAPTIVGVRPSETLGTASSTIRTLRSRARRGAAKHSRERLAHLRAPPRLPASVPRLAGRLVVPRDPLADRGRSRPRADGRRHQRDRRRRRTRDCWSWRSRRSSRSASFEARSCTAGA